MVFEKVQSILCSQLDLEESQVTMEAALQDDLGADRAGQRAHAPFQRLALKGKGHFCAVVMARLGNAPGDRAFVGDAHDEAFFPGHQLSSNGHGSVLAGDG